MSPIISRFEIIDLFGSRNVDIPFDSNCRILVGENGLGKTTILNILYFLLKGDYLSLSTLPFKETRITLSNKESFYFSKIQIDSFIQARREILLDLDDKDFEIIENRIKKLIITSKSFRELVLDDIIQEHVHGVNINKTRDIIELVENFENFYELQGYLLKENIAILYFPTFRRIENHNHSPSESTKESGGSFRRRYFLNEKGEEISSIENPNPLMKFGMKDVQNTISRLLIEIKNTYAKSFNDISAKTLHHILYSSDINLPPHIFKPKDVKLILNRIGDKLDESDKKKILRIVESMNFNHYPFLDYYLESLYQVYKNNIVIDVALKEFCNQCNKFLIGKKFIYDESNLQMVLIITDDFNPKVIALDKLSSGEKHIVSIMAYLYLGEEKKDKKTGSLHISPPKDSIIIIDEPELSISIYWQKELLPSMLQAKSCRQLIAVTHSPFIYSNGLEENALGPLEYVKY